MSTKKKEKNNANKSTTETESNNENKLIELIPNTADKKKLLKLPTAWIILMTIRLFLNITGQRSYIHPDEFFQGPEPLAGNIFNCSEMMYHTWEFKFTNMTTFMQEPIRNIAIPYFFYGLPLQFLKFLVGFFSNEYTNMRGIISENNLISIQTNTLIYYPRIFMTLCSVVIDFSMLKIAEYCGLDESSVLLTFASSYVTLVYLTRTFSNSIETILFSLLIFCVVKSIKSQHILNDKFLIASNNSPKHKQPVIVASTSPDLVASNIFDKKAELNSKSTVMKRVRLFDIYKCDYLGSRIGMLVCIGVFNRPTFLVYAFMPIIYWILYGLENCNSFKQAFAFIWRRVFSMIKFTLPVLAFLILFDTVYYLKITSLNQLIDVVFKNKRLIITPYNFFIYNTNSNNLKSHGSHPFYLHALVNCVLLFGINHWILVFIFGKFFFQLINYVKSVKASLNDTEHKGKASYFKELRVTLVILYEQVINNRFCFLMFSFLTPLVLLSVIPHQEPRFLLPLIIPVCLLTSHCLFSRNSYLILRTIWIIFNLFGVGLFGYLHQGGMVSSLAYVQKMFTHTSNLELDMHVIYYQTYMPPNYLTLAPFSVNILQSKRYIYERNRKKQLELEENLGFSLYTDEVTKPERKVYDLMASSNLNNLNQLLLEIKSNYTKNSKVKKDFAVFLVTPSVVDSKLFKPDDACSLNNSDVGFQLQTKFKFHLSFEHLKAHLDLINCNFKNNDCYLSLCKHKSLFDRIFNSFSLNMYQVIM